MFYNNKSVSCRHTLKVTSQNHLKFIFFIAFLQQTNYAFRTETTHYCLYKIQYRNSKKVQHQLYSYTVVINLDKSKKKLTAKTKHYQLSTSLYVIDFACICVH